MPFAETHVMEEKKRFIEEAHRSVRSFAAVCDRYGISRKTGYKWMDRWRWAGPVGLESRASRPRHCPWATPREVVEAILEVRRKYEDFGPKKIRWYLEDKPAGAGAALATDDAQHLGASRSGAEASTAGAPVASGSTGYRRIRAERNVDGRLQRRVPDGRRGAVLLAHSAGHAFKVSYWSAGVVRT